MPPETEILVGRGDPSTCITKYVLFERDQCLTSARMSSASQSQPADRLVRSRPSDDTAKPIRGKTRSLPHAVASLVRSAFFADCSREQLFRYRRFGRPGSGRSQPGGREERIRILLIDDDTHATHVGEENKLTRICADGTACTTNFLHKLAASWKWKLPIALRHLTCILQKALGPIAAAPVF